MYVLRIVRALVSDALSELHERAGAAAPQALLA
jgi:hypothetical protein